MIIENVRSVLFNPHADPEKVFEYSMRLKDSVNLCRRHRAQPELTSFRKATEEWVNGFTASSYYVSDFEFGVLRALGIVTHIGHWYEHNGQIWVDNGAARISLPDLHERSPSLLTFPQHDGINHYWVAVRTERPWVKIDSATVEALNGKLIRAITAKDDWEKKMSAGFIVETALLSRLRRPLSTEDVRKVHDATNRHDTETVVHLPSGAKGSDIGILGESFRRLGGDTRNSWLRDDVVNGMMALRIALNFSPVSIYGPSPQRRSRIQAGYVQFRKSTPIGG